MGMQDPTKTTLNIQREVEYNLQASTAVKTYKYLFTQQSFPVELGLAPHMREFVFCDTQYK